MLTHITKIVEGTSTNVCSVRGIHAKPAVEADGVNARVNALTFGTEKPLLTHTSEACKVKHICN